MVDNITAMAEKVTLLDLSIDNRSLLQSLANQKKAVEEQKKVLADLKKTTGEGTVEYQKATIALKELEGEYKSTQKVAVSLTTDINKQNVTIAEARKQLTAVSIQWAEQAKLYGENSKQAQELAKRKLELTEKLKLEEKATGDTRRNVGNYAQGMLEAIKGSKAFGDTLGAVGKINPFGLILTAVTLLIGSFKSLQPVMDAIGVVMGVISNVISVITERAGRLAQGLGKILTGNFKEGFDDLKGSIDGVGTALKDAAIAGAEYARVQKEIEDANRRIAVSNAIAEKNIAALTAKLRDRSLSEAERAKITEQITAIEQQRSKEELAALETAVKAEAARIRQALIAKGVKQEEIKALKTYNDLLEAGEKFQIQDETLNKFKDASVAYINAQRDSLAITERIEARRNTLLEAAADKQAKSEEKKAAAAAKAVAAEEKARQQIVKDIQDEIALFDIRNEAIIKSEQDLNEETIQLEMERLKSRQALNNALYTAQVVAGELSFELAVAQQEKEGEMILETTNKYLVQLGELRAAAILKEAELAKANMTKAQQEAFELRQMEIENEKLRQGETLELKRQELELQREQELISLEGNLQAQQALRDKYNIIFTKMEEDKIRLTKEMNLAAASEIAGNLAQILGEQTVVGKLAAIAQGTINVILAATQVLADFKSQSVFEKIANVTTILAAGFGLIKQMKAVAVPKFEDGGGIEIGGNRHSAGGTKFVGSDGTRFEAEKGEKLFILNRNASKEFNALAGFNDQYRVNAARPNYYASGGEVARAAATDVQQQQLGADIINAFQKVTIVTDVKDVIDQVGLRNQLTDLATI